MSNRFDDMRVKGINTNDATATASDIVSGKTAYVRGQKVTGILSPSGGSDDWNVFLQNSEPETKNGVWIKTNGSANPSVYFSTDFSAKGDFIDSSNLSYMNDFNSQTQVIIGDYMYSFGERTDGAIKYDLKNKRVVERFSLPNASSTLSYVYACEYDSEIHIFTYVNNARLEYYKYYPSSGTFSEVTTLTSVNTTDPYCWFFTQINDYVYWYQYSYYTGQSTSGLLKKISLETRQITKISSNPFRGVYIYNNYAKKREAVATTGNIIFLLDSIYSTQYPTNPDYNKTQLIKVDLSTGETGTLIEGVPAFGKIYASGNFLYLFPVGTNNYYYIYDINNDTWESLSITNSYTIYSFDGYTAGDYICFDYSSGIVYIRNESDMIGFQVAESPQSQDLDVGTVVIGETLNKRITKIQDSSNIHVGVYDTYVVRTENGDKYLDGSQLSFYGDGVKWSLIKNPTGETCTVSFDLNGGSGTFPSQQVIIGQTATQPQDVPTKSGYYLFDGWYLGNEPYNWNYKLISNITLTAHYMEYEEVDYIQSTGTQYIDTGVEMTSSKRVDVDFQVTKILSSHNPIVTSFADTEQNGFVFAQKQNGNFGFAYGSGWNGTEVQADLARHSASINKNDECLLDNVMLVDSSSITKSLNSGLNITILSWSENRYGYCKIYSCQIYDNGTLIRDFQPIKTSDDEYCLLDKVENKLYRNAGSGEFIGEGYEPTYVGYIQSSGTQYIDTGIIGKMGVKIEATLEMTSISGNIGIVGCRNNSGNTRFYMAHIYSSRWTFSILTDISGGIPSTNTLYNLVADTTVSPSTLSVNNSIEVTTSNTNDTSYNLFAFADNLYGNAGNYARMKLYSLKIYMNGTLMRDFKPCLDTNNVPCLWDKVTKNFFYNAGTGTFSYGV